MATTLLTVFVIAFVTLVSAQPWTDLQNDIMGNVLLPGTAAYDAIRDFVLRLPNDVPPDQPRAIVQPMNTQDVSKVMQFANLHNIPEVTALSGGHSNDGFSFPVDGIQVEFSLMTNINVNVGQEMVDFEPGVLSGNLSTALAPFNLGQVQGNCPTIGTGGFFSYGGFGAFTRTQGLGSDTLIEYEIVLANGDVKIANANQNSDLYFAARGALPAYGIATRFRAKVFPTSNFYGGRIFWDFNTTELAGSFLKDWYNNVNQISDLVNDDNFMARINIRRERSRRFIRCHLEIIFFGDDTVAQKKQRLLPLINVDAIDVYPEFLSTVDPPLFPQSYNDYHLYNFESSLITFRFVNNLQGYFRHGMVSEERLSAPGLIDSLVDIYMEGYDLDNPLLIGQQGELALAGGKVAAIPADESAFFSREFGFMWGYWTSYRNTPDFDAGRALYDDIATRLTSLAENRGYYGNLNTIKFGREFDALGTNLPRLEDIKQRFDPTGMFKRSWDISTGVGARCLSSCDNSIIIVNSLYLQLTMEFDDVIDFGDLQTDSYLSLALYNPDLGSIGLFDFESWSNNWTPYYTNGVLTRWTYRDGFNKVTLKDLDTNTPELKIRIFHDKFDIPSLPAEVPLYVRLETGTEVCLQTTYNHPINTHATLIGYQTCH